jgi:hypothetical protein
MHWQDYVISVAQIFIIFSLFSSVIGKSKPELSTSRTNAILVFIIATCFLSLHFWFSAVTAYGVSADWTILAIQKIRLDRSVRELKKYK